MDDDMRIRFYRCRERSKWGNKKWESILEQMASELQWGLTLLESYKQSKNFININNVGLLDRKSYIEEKWTTNEREKYEAEKYISGK